MALIVVLGFCAVNAFAQTPHRCRLTANNLATTGQVTLEIRDSAGSVVLTETHQWPSGTDLKAAWEDCKQRARARDVAVYAPSVGVDYLGQPNDQSGAIPGNALPAPSGTTLGGVKSGSCNGTDKVTGVNTDGTLACAADQSGGGGLPAGGIVLIISGTCAATLGTGWTEETALNGKFVLGTVAANADIATTGGQDTVTAILNHTHTVNVSDPGHTHTTQRYPTATGSSSGFTIDTSMSGTLADNTLPVKSSTTGVTASTVNPAGGVASIDNRPAFVKVIFCRKT